MTCLKRFSASEFWNVTRRNYALRLLPHPIDRYSDAASGLVDGAIFIFAKGTNPEALVIIEARRGASGATSWSYAAETLTTAAPTLKLDRKDVWTSPKKYGYLSNETYFFLERARQPNANAPAALSGEKIMKVKTYELPSLHRIPSHAPVAASGPALCGSLDLGFRRFASRPGSGAPLSR